MPPKNPKRDAEIIAMRNKNTPIKEIGKHFNMQPNTVAAVISRAIKDGTCTVFRDFVGYAKRDREIAKLHNEGMEDADLAEKYGMTKGGLTCLLSRLRVRGLITKAKKTSAEIGRSGGISKKKIDNTERDADIVRRFNVGESFNSIAASLGLSKGTIAGVVRDGRIAGTVTQPVLTPQQAAAKSVKAKKERSMSGITGWKSHVNVDTLIKKSGEKKGSRGGVFQDKTLLSLDKEVQKQPRKFMELRSTITNLPIKKPIANPRPSESERVGKTKLDHGIRATLPPKCKYELHGMEKLPRKNPEYVWCPNEIVRGNYCAEHHAVVYPARGKKYS